jgi:hypothetical protein
VDRAVLELEPQPAVDLLSAGLLRELSVPDPIALKVSNRQEPAGHPLGEPNADRRGVGGRRAQDENEGEDEEAASTETHDAPPAAAAGRPP